MDEKVINDYCQVVKHSTMYVDYFKTSTARFIRATVSSLPNTQEMSNMCGPFAFAYQSQTESIHDITCMNNLFPQSSPLRPFPVLQY